MKRIMLLISLIIIFSTLVSASEDYIIVTSEEATINLNLNMETTAKKGEIFELRGQ